MLRCHILASCPFLLVLMASIRVASARFSYSGCYPRSAFSGSGTSYTYQTTGYCADQCAGKNYYALIGGDSCLCSDTGPSKDSVDDSNCDVPCQGYNTINCGGDDYYAVYESSSASGSSNSAGDSSSSATSSDVSSSGASSTDGGDDATTADSSSSADSSTTDSSSSSRTTLLTSSSLATPSTLISTSLSVNTDNGKTITSAVIIRTTASFSDVYVTLTAAVPAAPSNTSSSGSGNKSNSSDGGSGLSHGSIAGIAIGAAGAIIIFAIVLFFIWRQRKKARDLEKAQNPAIAATKVANTYSNKHPEKNRFSGFDVPYYQDDEDGDLGPTLGSTGDGNHTSGNTSTIDAFSRNNSSRYKNDSGVGIQAISPSAGGARNYRGAESNIPGPSSPRIGDGNGANVNNIDHHNNTNGADDGNDDEFHFASPPSAGSAGDTGAASGLRIMNPDDESIKSDKSGIGPLNPNIKSHTQMNSGASGVDSDDEDLFKDRVRD